MTNNGNLVVKMNPGITLSNKDKIMTMRSYVVKKFMIEERKSLASGTISKNRNTGTTRMNYKDPLNEIFEKEDNIHPPYYDFPCIKEKIRNISNIPTPVKQVIDYGKNELLKNLLPNQYFTMYGGVGTNLNQEDSETLTISSSKGQSVKSIQNANYFNSNSNNFRSNSGRDNFGLNIQNTFSQKYNTIDSENMRNVSNINFF